jgi:hypothetical protein
MNDFRSHSDGYDELSLLGYTAVLSVTFNGLQGIISQKVELFITAAMGTPDPAIPCPTPLGNVAQFTLACSYTEQNGSSGPNAPDLHSGGARLESWLGQRLS